MENPRIPKEVVEKLKAYVGKRVEVDSIERNYEFSESYGKIYCCGISAHSRGPAMLVSVDSNVLVLQSGGMGREIIRMAEESRYPGGMILGGEGSECYNIDMVTRVEAEGQVLFNKSPEDYMPEDIKEKIKTHKCEPLPPSPDED